MWALCSVLGVAYETKRHDGLYNCRLGEPKMPSDCAEAIEALRRSLRSAATNAPKNLPALLKDVGVLIKLLRNPAEKPEEAKFRTLKLTNAAIARVIANAGVREVLQACGFAGDSRDEQQLELGDVSAPAVALLLRAVDGVEAVHRMLQEL